MQTNFYYKTHTQKTKKSDDHIMSLASFCSTSGHNAKQEKTVWDRLTKFCVYTALSVKLSSRMFAPLIGVKHEDAEK